MLLDNIKLPTTVTKNENMSKCTYFQPTRVHKFGKL